MSVSANHPTTPSAPGGVGNGGVGNGGVGNGGKNGDAQPLAVNGGARVSGGGRLEFRDVSKIFRASRVAALEKLTVTCEPGEFVVVVGPSGCGKTTMLNLAAGMLTPDSGQVLLDDRPVRAPGPDRAVVFQDHALFPWLTAEQNIEFGLRMARVNPTERRRRVGLALELVHLSHAGGKLPHELSGGMRQRVALARALVMNPRVLLMDEPFAALDVQTRAMMHNELAALWLRTRKTVLFVTHSVSEALRLADRIIVLHAHPGRVRREFVVRLPRPRDLRQPEAQDLALELREEIDIEVDRVHAIYRDEAPTDEPYDDRTAAAAQARSASPAGAGGGRKMASDVGSRSDLDGPTGLLGDGI
jgi:NitT/TauT family transport system ATP-binding protein